MKILHVGEYVKGGVATYLRTLIKYQCQRKDQVYLLLSSFNSEHNWPLSNSNIYYYSYKRNMWYVMCAMYQIYKYIRIIKPDIIHVHSSWAGLYVRLLYFFLPRKPKIIYCAHGWSFLIDTNLLKKKIYSVVEWLLSYKTDVIINISKYEHEQAINYGIPPSKMVMIYNGTDDNSDNNSKTEFVKFDNEKINILFIGRFDRQKGLDILLDILSKNKLDKVSFYIVGDKVISELGIVIPDGVHHIGWINNEQIDYYYKACDAVIMPSRWEGFGLVAIEAMRNRKAVIASNRGALPELIHHGTNGYIFDLEDIEQLKDILNNIDKKTLHMLGENGYLHYKQHFTASKMNERINDVYAKLLNTRFK